MLTFNMHVKKISLIFLVFLSIKIYAQEPPPPVPCTAIGQTPASAIPICGIDPIIQGPVPLCGGKPITTICFLDLKTFEERNPSWYKFTCYGTGTLGFEIKPDNLNDDYNWQIFDVTGKDLSQVYGRGISLLVGSNWSGLPGYTGARENITAGLYGCNELLPKLRTFSDRPVIKNGHNYLLLVNHPDDIGGFTLTFKKGTAIIKDPLDPALKSAASNCLGTEVRVKLNKKMKCSSVAADGSDFSISPALASIVAATGFNCNNRVDVDSVTLTLSNSLPAGNYTVSAKNGSDNNTILDNCDLAIVQGNSVPFTVYPVSSSALDSISAVGCSPDNLQLIFRQYVNCSSISADGSEFAITGPSTVNITSASSECDNTVNYILLNLASPILVPGDYKVTLQKGSDGNTIINECGLESPPGSTINFTAKASVSGKFTYSVLTGCKYDTIKYFQSDATGVTSRKWTFDDNQTSTLQNPVIIYSKQGKKKAILFVTNEFCSDSATSAINLTEHSHSGFDLLPPTICPLDSAGFTNTSTGNILSWNWSFGNGKYSTDKNPEAQHYPFYSHDTYVPVSLVTKDNLDCFDTLVKQLKVLYNCYIAVPTAFSPNSDGRNDYLYPLNAYKADNLDFRVYNRYGQLVFSTKDWTHKWDGTINGQPQGTGTYLWILIYKDHDTGKVVSQHGTTVLLR